MKIKKCLFLIIAVVSIIISCKKEEKFMPVSAFYFSMLDTVSVPTRISFNNISTNATVYRWNFGDNTPLDYSKNPVHTYSKEGIYNVELITYSDGGMNTLVKQVFIVPIPGFTYAMLDTCKIPTRVKFTNTSSFSSEDLWDFGDSTTSTERNPEHTYYHEKIYTVTLKTGKGFNKELKLQVYIVKNPVINFMANDTTITAGDSVRFSAQSLSGVLPSTLLWSFGDGFTSSSQNPYHKYIYPGYKSVYLSASNACGISFLEKQNYIKVDSILAAPITDFFADRFVIGAGQTVYFYDMSSFNPTSWSWTFSGGNPSSSNMKNPNGIVYPNVGVYDVSLTSTNPLGNSSKTKNAYITVVPSPVADFIGDSLIIKVGQSVDFTNLSSYDAATPVGWSWTFENGNPSSSTEKNPANINYTSIGNFSVSLTVSNQYGSNTLTRTAYIKVNPISPAPVADFNSNVQNLSQGQNVNFHDLSLNNPTSWNWTFNGGNPGTSTLQNPVVNYPVSGVYDVSLTVSNLQGNNSITKTAYIHVNIPPPVVDFSITPNPVMIGQPVNFTDLSTNSPTSWSWNFQGGSPISSTSQNPANVFFWTAGTYNVSLTATNAGGSNIKTKNIVVQNTTIGNAAITKITVNQFPAPPLPQMVNLYYRISNFSSGLILVNGRSQSIPNVVQSSLPVFWNALPLPYQLPQLNQLYKIELWDKKSMAPQDVSINYVQFNPNNYPNHPATINLNQNGLSVDIDITWQ